jgi:hypothetical protein
MANTKRVQLRRGTTAEHAVFVGAEGELTIDTTRDIAIVHDGVTVGGHELVGVAATGQSIVNKVSVGIGTSNATSALTVFGNSLITGVSTFNSAVSFGSSAYFGDNDKIILGDGNDFQIYHDTSNSYIDDAGTGDLYIRSNAIRLQKYTGETSAVFLSDSSVELYFDNVKEFETTGFGATVFGTLASQQLNVSGVSTFVGNVNLSGELRGPAEFIIDPAAVGNNTGAVRIKGDLFVDGTTTQINSTSLEIADFIVGIASTATTDLLADGAGIKIGPDNTLLYDHSNTALKSSENFNLVSGKTYKINGSDVLSSTTLGSGVLNSSLTSVGTLGLLTVGAGGISATGLTTSAGFNATTGNDYKINGTSVLTSTTLGSGITASSLTSVGTLSSLNVSGNVTGSGANAAIQFSPTGTGSVTISPATAGNINNMNIGATTKGTGAFSSLAVKDTSANFDVNFVPTSSTALTGTRNLTFDVVNAARSIKLAGNLDIANNFITSGNFALTLTSTNTTNATIPAGTVTLVDLSSSQNLSNKTCDFPTATGSITSKSYVDAMTIAFGC